MLSRMKNELKPEGSPAQGCALVGGLGVLLLGIGPLLAHVSVQAIGSILGFFAFGCVIGWPMIYFLPSNQEKRREARRQKAQVERESSQFPIAHWEDSELDK